MMFVIFIILATFIVFTLIVVDIFYLSVSRALIKSYHDEHNLILTNWAKRALRDQAKAKPIDQDHVLILADQHSNLAMIYTHEWNKVYSKVNDNWTDHRVTTCDVVPPPIESIGFNNIYWQSIINSEDLTLYLYNAYFDNRQTVNKVRVLGVSDHFNLLTNTTLW